MTRSTQRLIWLLAALALLAGCATAPVAPAASTDTTASTASGSETKTLDLWFNGEDAWNQYIEAVIVEFEQANPGVDIVYSPYANESYKTTVQVAIGSDDPPDMFFNWAGEDTARYVREGHLLDLTAYAADLGWNDQLSAASLNAFTQDGKLYAAPYSQESKFFYYHKDMLAQNGIEEPATFEDLLAACTTLKAAGVTPLAFGNQERWEGVHYMTIFNQKMAGEETILADYTLATPAESLFTDPGYEAAFQKLLDMQNAGCFGDAVNSTTPDAALIQFVNQQTAMYYQGTWIIGSLSTNGLDGAYGMFPMPPISDPAAKGSPNFITAGPVGVEVSAKTPYPDVAIAFLDFFVSQPKQQTMLESLSRLPVRADAVNPEAVSESVISVVDDLSAAGGVVLWLDVILENSVSEVYLNSIQEVLAGTQTPAEAVAAVREQALKVQAERAQP